MKFNFSVFLIAIITIILLTLLSLIGFAAVEVGTEGTGVMGVICHFLAFLYYVFRFPSHTFLFEFLDGAFLFFLGLLINCMFWGLITERIYTLIIAKKKKS